MYKQMIYYFITVVEEGSFLATSKKYYLSQPAISQQISKLEEELGFQLFNRKTYRPTLTNKGEKFYQLCKESISHFDSELSKIKNDKQHITIGITGPFEKKHLPIIIKEFKKNHDIQIDIKVFDFKGIVNELLNNHIDIGFSLKNDFEHYKEISFDNIYKPSICIVASKEHHLSKKNRVSIYDIQNEPIVVLSSKIGTYYYEDFMKAFQQDGIKPKIVKTVDNLNEYLMAIELGEGIGLTAQEIINDNDEVITRDLYNSHHSVYFSIGILKDNNNKIVKELYQIILEYFEQYK